MRIPLYKAQACIPRPTLRIASCRHEPDVTLNTSVLIVIMMRIMIMVFIVVIIMIIIMIMIVIIISMMAVDSIAVSVFVDFLTLAY